MQENVLNKKLYTALQELCGDVKIGNQGEARVVHYSPDYEHGGRLKARPGQQGEQYLIQCPVCGGDRCYLSYEYGVRDEITGGDNQHLVHCFHGDCFKNAAARQKLWMRLQSRRIRQSSADIRVARSTGRSHPVITLPDNLTPINRLPAVSEPANYLRDERGFDLEELWGRWQVSYCGHATNVKPAVHDRLVLPIYRQTRTIVNGAWADTWTLAGWQARYIGDPPAQEIPKYLFASGMLKSHLLYGLTQAMESTGPIIIVEGVTDVWRLFPNAVCGFGTNLSAAQRDLLGRFDDRPIAVVMDNDAIAEAEKIVLELQACRRSLGNPVPVVLVQIPEGRDDPAACAKEEVLTWVEEALAR